MILDTDYHTITHPFCMTTSHYIRCMDLNGKTNEQNDFYLHREKTSKVKNTKKAISEKNTIL